MEVIRLRVDSWIIKWANICVEWFMNFFADPEFYWVEETYPKGSNNTRQEEKTIKTIKRKTNTLEIVDSVKSKGKKLIMHVSSPDKLQLSVNTALKLILINGSRVFRPFQFVYIWDKLKYNVSNTI